MDRLLARSDELRKEGVVNAHEIAFFEHRVREWPEEWGRQLRFILFGTFFAPSNILKFPSLGITIASANVRSEKSIARSALTVLEGTIDVPARTVEAVVGAARQINVLVGALSLYEWGNGDIRWWCQVYHGGLSGSIKTKLEHDGFDLTINAILKLRPDVRQKLDAALFWVTESHLQLMEKHNHSPLREFAAYWNAFECLVDAVHLVRPMTKRGRKEKQSAIDEFFRDRPLTAENIQSCYRNFIDPGFRGKARHALQICFANEADRYFDECFSSSTKEIVFIVFETQSIMGRLMLSTHSNDHGLTRDVVAFGS